MSPGTGVIRAVVIRADGTTEDLGVICQTEATPPRADTSLIRKAAKWLSLR